MFNLNVDQIRVVESVMKWFSTSDGVQSEDMNPIVLVHGVFGSGKSYFLVSLIIFLSRLLEFFVFQKDDQPPVRILVSSATNTAVDRVLLGLLEQQFTDFIRVGSVKKIAKPILSHMLDNSPKEETIKELKRMLKETTSPTEMKYVKAELEELLSGREEMRKELLKKVRVVGVTCAASVFQILDGNKFQIVFLDECSQMIEPLSLLPLRFGAEKMICVGDPHQLPPTLTNYQEDFENGLAKTIFSRLSEDFIPIMLRTQYRCHPKLSQMASQLFYKGQLLDGISESDRSPLLALPPLLFCDDNTGVEQSHYGSYWNELETQVTGKLLQMLLAAGICSRQIGVIALYKEQAKRIWELILGGTLRVTTKVDEADALQEPDDEPTDETEKKEKEVELDPRDIQVSTVDAFQGAEKEVIIVVCSRTTGLGFMDSPKRINVALTRARRHLIIVGKKAVLAKDKEIWASIITQSNPNLIVAAQVINATSFHDLFTASAQMAAPATKQSALAEQQETDYDDILKEFDTRNHQLIQDYDRKREEQEENLSGGDLDEVSLAAVDQTKSSGVDDDELQDYFTSFEPTSTNADLNDAPEANDNQLAISEEPQQQEAPPAPLENNHDENNEQTLGDQGEDNNVVPVDDFDQEDQIPSEDEQPQLSPGNHNKKPNEEELPSFDLGVEFSQT